MALYLGIDWGATFVKLGLVKENRILEYLSLPAETLQGPQDLINILENFLKKHSIQNLKGIGIGCPGIINIRKGLIYWLPNIKGWENVPLRTILEKRFHTFCYVDNDANLNALGEVKFGRGKGLEDVICLTLGTGLGGGIILRGGLFHGLFTSAGELGHLSIDPKGNICSCGNRGCIETFVGNKYIIDLARAHLRKRRSYIVEDILKRKGDNLTPQILTEAANRGCRLSQEIWEEVSFNLARYIAGLVNIFSPQAIIIGGGLSKAGRFLFTPLRRYVKKWAMYPQNQMTKILKARLNERATILGAKQALVEFRIKKIKKGVK